jgi:hypothetical protein
MQVRQRINFIILPLPLVANPNDQSIDCATHDHRLIYDHLKPDKMRAGIRPG